MILERLQLIQGNQSDKEFADRLKIHRISWQRIKNRRVPVSDKFLVRVLRAFPEMKTIVDIYLADGVINGIPLDIDYIGNLSAPKEPSQLERGLASVWSFLRGWF